MTTSMWRRASRAWDVKRRNSDSGVLIRMSGGAVSILRRSSGGVSPVRTPTTIGDRAVPSRAAAASMPVSGDRRFRSTSTARAFSGEMYRTRSRSFFGGTVAVASRSIDHKKAASVLPEPVGATTRAFSSEEMAFQAPVCASVGRSKADPNHSRVASENGRPAATAQSCLTAATSASRRPRRDLRPITF